MQFLPSLDSLLFDDSHVDLTFNSDFAFDPIICSISDYIYTTLVHGPTVNLFVNLISAGPASIQSSESAILVKLNHQSYRFVPSSLVQKDNLINVQVSAKLTLRLQFSSPDTAHEFYKNYYSSVPQVDFASLVAHAKLIRDQKVLSAENEYQARLKELHEMFPAESSMYPNFSAAQDAAEQDLRVFANNTLPIDNELSLFNPQKPQQAPTALENGTPDDDSVICKICFDGQANIRTLISQRLEMQSFHMFKLFGQFEKKFLQYMSLGPAGNLNLLS